MKNILLIIFLGISATACAKPKPALLIKTSVSKAWTQHADVLAYLNPDKSIVVVVANHPTI